MPLPSASAGEHVAAVPIASDGWGRPSDRHLGNLPTPLGDSGYVWGQDPEEDESCVLEERDGGEAFSPDIEYDLPHYCQDASRLFPAGHVGEFRGSSSWGSFDPASSGGPTTASCRSSVSDTGTFSSFSPPADISASLPPLPGCFRCPINQQVMTDPVCTVDGTTYERENIVAYLNSGRRISPATGQELSSLELRPNDALKAAIQGYLELHEGADYLQREWESYVAHLGHNATQKLVQRQRQVRALRAALEQSDRRIHALSSQLGISKPRTEEADSATASTADTSNRTPSDGSPAARLAEPTFKSGPAPRAASRACGRPSARRKRNACLPFLPGRAWRGGGV